MRAKTKKRPDAGPRGAQLGTAEVAKRIGRDRRTAYRWMLTLEATYGTKVIGRRGKRGVLFTTEGALSRVVPFDRTDREQTKVERQLSELRDLVDAQAKRVDAMYREFRAKLQKLDRK